MPLTRFWTIWVLAALAAPAVAVVTAPEAETAEEAEHPVRGSGYTPNFETTADAEKNVFNDMESHWGKEIVALLAERGIVDGMPDGGFHPDQAVTRAEYLKLLTTALGLSPVMSDSFSDVAADEWYYGIIGAAKQAGLAVGDGDSFRPNETITREDAAVLLFRAMGNKGLEGQEQISFEDGEEISQYAAEAVAALSSSGILQGDQGRFLPKASTTRAEAAVMIYRMLEQTEGVSQ